MADLKPCPFCGGEAKIEAHRSGEDSMDTFVRCTECFVETDRIDAPYAEPEMAAELWNRRAKEGADSEPVAWEASVDTPTGRYVELWTASKEARAREQVDGWRAAGDEGVRLRALYATPRSNHELDELWDIARKTAATWLYKQMAPVLDRMDSSHPEAQRYREFRDNKQGIYAE